MTDIDSYHGQPILKEPTWTWEIPCYFYAGGLAGASAGLAYLSELRGNELLARRAWAAAMFGIGVSPALLTSDLGRPLRFLNMLRMFKVTSPMSVGSWILTGSGATTALAAAASRFGRIGQVCVASGAALLAARGGRSRGAAIAGGALLSAGALSARWSVFKAGFQSAANPKYVVRPQRDGIERGEHRGAARRQSHVRDPELALGSPATAPQELFVS